MTIAGMIEFDWMRCNRLSTNFRLRGPPKVEYRVVIRRNLRLEVLYTGRVLCPRRPVNPDVINIIITDAIRHCPYLIVGVGIVEDELDDLPIAIYEPRLELTPDEKRPRLP